MAELLEQDPKPIDDKLAEFTDQILAAGEPDRVPLNGVDPELAALQQTVIRLKEAVESERPDPALARRISRRLSSEWRRQQVDQPRRKRLGWLDSGSMRQPQFARLALALTMLAIVALVVFSTGAPPPALPGAAGSSAPAPALILTAAVAAGVLLYLLRSKK